MSKSARSEFVETGSSGRLPQPNCAPSRAVGAGLADDFVLPTLLFMALGAMTWAVRGSSGFGAVNGCVFAGVTWGAAWWFIAREHGSRQARRYSSGWIILALTLGIGISGNRGWMQWPSFFEGSLRYTTPSCSFSRGSSSATFPAFAELSPAKMEGLLFRAS